jgi:hypothetical protein
VRARERDHVQRAEVVLGEHGGEVLDAHVGSRQLARDVAGLGDEPVQPPKLDGPVGAGRLPFRRTSTQYPSETELPWLSKK